MGDTSSFELKPALPAQQQPGRAAVCCLRPKGPGLGKGREPAFSQKYAPHYNGWNRPLSTTFLPDMPVFFPVSYDTQYLVALSPLIHNFCLSSGIHYK